MTGPRERGWVAKHLTSGRLARLSWVVALEVDGPRPLPMTRQLGLLPTAARRGPLLAAHRFRAGGPLIAM